MKLINFFELIFIMDTQTGFEADDFILCTKCNNLLMIPANTKQVICSECENIMDYINISENHKFLSYKKAFKNLSARIYKERAEKNYIYNSKQVAAQQAAQQAAQISQHQAAYEQQQAAAAAQHYAKEQAAKEQAEADRLVTEQQAAATAQAVYEQQAAAAAQHYAKEQAAKEQALELNETRQAAITLLLVPISVRLNTSIIKN